MSLYLILNILALAVPLVLSFDRRVHFYTRWKYSLPSMLIVMILFMSWDVVFTRMGVWGFNERYHHGSLLLGLPAEEILFFVSVPYASLFTIFVLKHYFPGYKLNRQSTRLLTAGLIVGCLILAILYSDRSYTLVNFLFAAGLLLLVFLTNSDLLSRFFPAYLVILIPFFIMNGILTGSWIEDQVVWYDDLENMGIRLGTIPFEDIFYGMSLILLNYFLTMHLQSRSEGGDQ